MTRPIITLMTDFGEGSPYVAQMKAAILAVNSDVTIVDVTHAICPQDIRHGALVLADAWHHFPTGTIHIAVVDPGVGTKRAIICATCNEHRFIAPDNGLLTSVLEAQPAEVIFRLEDEKFWRAEVSPTFHGRDIMAPAAAHLARGVPPSELGPPHETPILIDFPKPIVSDHEIVGEIVAIDSFGNLITNIPTEWLGGRFLRATIGTLAIDRFAPFYADLEVGDVAVIPSSTGTLELAERDGSLAARASLQLGARVRIETSRGQSD